MFLGSGHRVTGEFRRSQIVTPVAAECIARMGVTTPCESLSSGVGVQAGPWTVDVRITKAPPAG